jgi:preprotein translocase subunit SecF
MGAFRGKYIEFYDKHSTKLLIATVIFFLVFASVIVVNYARTGEFFQKGVSLRGGSIITVQLSTPVDVEAVQKSLEKLATEEISVTELSAVTGEHLGFIVETTLQNISLIKSQIQSGYDVKTMNVENVGPRLGASFFNQLKISVIIAFLLMAAVIFAYFRSPLPSSYIVLSAVVDILFPLAMVVILNVKVSAAGIAAFLMLIGYSVDTDILLTTRVLKGKTGTVSERICGAMSTGIVMTIAAMAATGIAYLTTPSEVLKQITMILFFGLVADIPSTWFQNAGLLKLYAERKQREKKEEEDEEEND